MNGAPASPLPPSIIFDSESAPDWFVRYRDEEKTKQTKLQARIDELEKSLKLAQGFRLDGPREVKIGTVRFTETETGILRSLAGVGCAMKEVHGNALYRHASNIRKKLREAGVDPSDPKQSNIRTDINLGYRVDDKFQAYLKRLVAGEPAKAPNAKKAPRLSAPKRTLNLEHRSAA